MPGKPWGSQRGKTSQFFKEKKTFLDRNPNSKRFFETRFNIKVRIFSVSQRTLVGGIWGPNEPCPANLWGPEGGKRPYFLCQKSLFLDRNSIYWGKIQYKGHIFFQFIRGLLWVGTYLLHLL